MAKNLRLIRLFIGAAVFAAGLIFYKYIQSELLILVIFIVSYLILGIDIVFKALKNLLRGQIFDENFLMSLATIGAFVIGESPEAAAVMLFFQAGEYFQEKAVEKSKKSITDLMDIRPDYANLLENNESIKVSPDSVTIGSFIIVKPGEKIPLDGIITDGASMIDTSAMTGESIPRKAEKDDTVLSGCVNISGKLTIKVTKTFGESAVSKIINLVENSANKKAKTEKFITKFARIYTPIVVILAVLLAFLPPLIIDGNFSVWIHRALVFLVISCPCALVLSIPMGFFAGIGRAAKSGILIKGGNYLEAFNQLDTIVFDKTGTLTCGVFIVTKIKSANGFSENELLELAAKAESFSNHPIALSITQKYGNKIDTDNLSDYTELAGLGISVTYNGKIILAGNKNLLLKYGIIFEETSDTGTKVYVTYDGVYAGCIIISDEIKPDSRDIISRLKEKGIQKTIMLTGDNKYIAESVATELNLDEVYAELLPHEKVQITEKLIKQKYTKDKKASRKNLAFVGDGINDAPVLVMADIGIAMGALGSDAAIEAADVVLMTDELSKLSEVINISRYTKKIIRQNIIFILGIKTVFLILGAFGIATMWEAVFADVGVSLLAVLNVMRIMHLR